MKTPKPNQQSLIKKHLSPGERKVFHTGIQNRAKYWRRMKRLRAIGNGLKRTILFALCVGLFFAGSAAKAQAATSQAGVSAPALFNDANAARHAGRLGPAILGYERASLLAPGDPAIAQNLRIAREKAGVTAPIVPIWQRPAHWLSFDCMAALASISLLLFCLIFFGTRLISTTLRHLARGVASVFCVTALLAATAVAVRWPELDRAVIIGTRPVAHIAPASDAVASFELKPGAIVCTENSYGDFVRIRTDDGRSGWVNRVEVENIVPAGAWEIVTARTRNYCGAGR